MEKIKLINTRKRKGMSTKEMADLIPMEEYSYRRREKGETRITYKEWQKIAAILEVEVEDIFETEQQAVNIHNENGQVNNSTYTGKIQYYNIPKEMVENQQEYIVILKKEIEELKNENFYLKEQIQN
jgi:transcriptional regulator with XRE-family HTH domain